MKLKHLGFLASLLLVFTAGAKTGVQYAKRHYVAKDRKFIEGKIIKNE